MGLPAFLHSSADLFSASTMASGGDGLEDISPDWAGTSLVDLTSPELEKGSVSMLDSGEDFEVLDDDNRDGEDDLSGLPPLEDIPPSKDASQETTAHPPEEGSKAEEEWLDVLGKNMLVFGTFGCIFKYISCG